MMRLGFLLVGTGCFAVPLALGQTGCFGSGTTSNNNSSSTDTGGASTTTSADGGGGSSGSGSAGTGGTTPGSCTNSALLIDDMTNPASPTITGGYWYTYSDRTCVSPLPALIRGDAAGTIIPEEGQQYLSTTGASNDGPNPCGTGAVSYRDFSGGMENNWGAGMGFDLADTAPTGAFASCTSPEQCTGTEAPDAYTPPSDGGGSFAAPFDASKFKGVTFFIRAPDTGAVPVKVNVQLSDKSTNPGGGTCDQCLYGGPAASATTIRCADDWIKTVSATSSWTQQTVLFNDPTLKTGGWSTGNTPRASSAIDLKSLYYVHFQLSTNGAPPLKAFHIQVAYLGFTQ